MFYFTHFGLLFRRHPNQQLERGLLSF